MEKILAWHGDPKKKAARLKRVRAHVKADQLIQGYGHWKDGKGCAIGCSYHSSDHSLAQSEDGIPIGIAYLVDRLFEQLPVEEARTWPVRFFNAIKPGADLSLVWDKNWEWVLRELQKEFEPINRPILDGIIGLFTRRAAGDFPTQAQSKAVGDKLRADLADLAYRVCQPDYALHKGAIFFYSDSTGNRVGVYGVDSAESAQFEAWYFGREDHRFDLIDSATRGK